MRKLIFDNVKRRIPKISDTERIALNCGTTSIDRDLFEGKVQKQNFDINDNILDFTLKKRTDKILQK